MPISTAITKYEFQVWRSELPDRATNISQVVFWVRPANKLNAYAFEFV
jgi:hypothetical protein